MLPEKTQVVGLVQNLSLRPFGKGNVGGRSQVYLYIKHNQKNIQEENIPFMPVFIPLSPCWVTGLSVTLICAVRTPGVVTGMPPLKPGWALVPGTIWKRKCSALVVAVTKLHFHSEIILAERIHGDNIITISKGHLTITMLLSLNLILSFFLILDTTHM